jgi:hypothetical protein
LHISPLIFENKYFLEAFVFTQKTNTQNHPHLSPINIPPHAQSHPDTQNSYTSHLQKTPSEYLSDSLTSELLFPFNPFPTTGGFLDEKVFSYVRRCVFLWL